MTASVCVLGIWVMFGLYLLKWVWDDRHERQWRREFYEHRVAFLKGELDRLRLFRMGIHDPLAMPSNDKESARNDN